MNSRTKAVGTKIEALGGPKRGQNEAKMEPRGTQNEPKMNKSGTKGEVWDHMWKMSEKKRVSMAILGSILGAIFDQKTIQKHTEWPIVKGVAF